MKIFVPVKMVPDLVEELEIADSGDTLDTTWLRLILNELDDHAIEQAILLKERHGGTVTVIAPDVDGAEDVLFMAGAKGADRLIRLSGDFESGVDNHRLAMALKTIIEEEAPSLILTGVQAHDDLDGPVGILLAQYLELPYVGYVSGVEVDGDICTVQKEYPGGLVAEMQVVLPALLGIQAADQPPRYIAISKVRQMKKTATIEDSEIADSDEYVGATINRLYQPEVGDRATMIEGDEHNIAAKLVEILKDMNAL